MWYIIKPKERKGGLVFLRSLIANNDIKQLYAKQVYRGVNIYAVELDDKSKLVLNTPHDVLLKTNNIELGDGWEKIEVYSKDLKHKRYHYIISSTFIRVGGVEAPLFPLNVDNYEAVDSETAYRLIMGYVEEGSEEFEESTHLVD